jgi:hypothetical protein
LNPFLQERVSDVYSKLRIQAIAGRNLATSALIASEAPPRLASACSKMAKGAVEFRHG